MEKIVRVVPRMSFRMLLLLVFTTTLALCSPYSGHVPPGKELIYEYHARMRVGTHEPVTYASQFILEGRLHLQNEQGYTLAKFSDLSFKLYNGELNLQSEHTSQSLPLPPEANELLNSFRIKYDDNGKALCIFTNAKESEYSRNFKKAIASILQLDVNSLKFDAYTPYAFLTEERNIYGTTEVDYNVIPGRDNELIVRKQNEVKTSKNWYKYFNINAEPLLTGPPLVSPLTLDSHREYTVVKTSQGVQMKLIETSGDIYVHPISGMAEHNYVSVNQTFRLHDITTPKEYSGYPPPQDKCTDDLSFTYDVETESGTMRDMTFGRRPIHKDQLIASVQKSLEDVIVHLEENHLTVEPPHVLKGQAINNLQKQLSLFDVPTLDKLYAKLCEQTGEIDKQKLNIFQQVIPLVGTRASTVFIQRLICTRKVSDAITIDLLRKMPFSLRMPSERLLAEVDELINIPKPVNETVQQAAILSFATLVHKVFARKQLFEENINNWNYHTTRGNSVHSRPREENNPLLEKYILEFVNRLKEAKDYPTQYLYMQALHNIEVGNVVKHLEPYVKGEVQNSNRNLRVLAMYASLPGQIIYPERTYKIYWPIFTDRRLHLEIRTAAYNVIMATKPSMSKLWNIYWYMQSDTNPELYHYYYTNIRSLATSANPLTEQYKIYAQQILKFLRRPYKPYMSANYVYDYIDPKYGYGALLETSTLSTNTSRAFYIDLINNVFNVPYHYYSLYVKIDGLDESDLAKPTDEKYSDIYELQKIIQTLVTLHHKKKITVEYFILKHHQVIQIGLYDHTNITEVVDTIKNIVTSGEKWLETYLEIDYFMMKDLVLPNDLGFLTYLQIKTPNVINSQSDCNSEFANRIITMNGDFRLHNSIRSTYDTRVYNPVSDIWHGFHRIRSFDFVLPINFNLMHNLKQFAIKLTLKRHKDEIRNIVGLRSHVTLQTYVADDESSFLNKSNSGCRPYTEVTVGRKYRKTYDLLNVDDDNTGLRYQVAVFDSEQQLYHKSILELLEDALYDKRDLYQNRKTAQLLTLGQNLWLRTVLYPGIGVSGFLARAVPSTKYQVSQIDLSLRVTQELNRDEGVHLPGTKLNTKATYSIKFGEKILKTLEVNGGLTMNAGHTVNNLKLQISKNAPEQKDLKICLEGNKKWEPNGVTSHMVISIGQTTDSKCSNNEASIEIDMKGELSDKQYEMGKFEHRKYSECFMTHLYEPNLNDVHIKKYNVHECTAKYLSLRKYDYNIQYTPIPEYIKSSLKVILDVFKVIFVPHSWHDHRLHTYLVALNNLNVNVEYPVIGYELEVEVAGSPQSYNVTGISSQDLEYIGIYPDNYHYSYKHQLLHRFGLTKTCLANKQTIFTSGYHIAPLDDCDCDWIQLASDTANQTLSVLVGKGVGVRPLILRIVFQNQVLEVKPDGSDYQITLNGKSLNLGKKFYHYDTWFSYGILPDERHTVSVNVYKYGLYIDFNGETIKMDAPVYGFDLIGKCFS